MPTYVNQNEVDLGSKPTLTLHEVYLKLRKSPRNQLFGQHVNLDSPTYRQRASMEPCKAQAIDHLLTKETTAVESALEITEQKPSAIKHQ